LAMLMAFYCSRLSGTTFFVDKNTKTEVAKVWLFSITLTSICCLKLS